MPYETALFVVLLLKKVGNFSFSRVSDHKFIGVEH